MHHPPVFGQFFKKAAEQQQKREYSTSGTASAYKTIARIAHRFCYQSSAVGHGYKVGA
jgi:hypothetical protein